MEWLLTWFERTFLTKSWRPLQKPRGGVRGIVVGDIVRRLVAKTFAQELSHHIEAATSPFQHALTTRSGCECIAHAVQALTDVNPEATVLSVDGIGAFDLISRASMLTALRDLPGCDRALPFVRQFYGRVSKCFWEDDGGTTHEICRAKEGNRETRQCLRCSHSDNTEPSLLQSAMHPSAKLMAFLDDVYVVTSPPQVAECFTHLERELWAHAGIRINLGKTQIFQQGRRSSSKLPAHYSRQAVSWRGDSGLPAEQQGVTILGTPLGHVEFVKSQLRAKSEEHGVLLSRVEAVSDLQCAWLILSCCCVARANCYLRTIHPEGSEESARTHDMVISAVFNSLLDIQGDQSTFNLASLPCRLGGVGLRNAARGAQAAYWSSWADSLHMIRKRHFITVALDRGGGGPHTEVAAHSREALVKLGFDVPEWGDLARGLRPDFHPAADPFPGSSRHG